MLKVWILVLVTGHAVDHVPQPDKATCVSNAKYVQTQGFVSFCIPGVMPYAGSEIIHGDYKVEGGR